MARMHTRKKGKSGSRAQFSTENHTWVEMSNDEIKETVVKLKNEGLSKSLIGIRLRDQYGIPSTKVMFNQKLGVLLGSEGLAENIPEDLNNLISRYQRVKRHNQLNSKDTANARNGALIMAKILRLVRYYKRKGVLPAEWKLGRVIK
ncbi:30S ribosomal protein S15 [uncultured archaeon]|nr:30S ribosomal protein S15 [uncultured archaeon]